MNNEADWTRVWEAAEQARAALGWNKTDLYRRARISETTYITMSNGRPLTRLDKRTAFAAAFGWTADDLDRIAEGGDAPPVNAVGPVNLLDEVRELRSEVETLREIVMTLIART